MTRNKQTRVIDAELVRQAGHLIDRAIDEIDAAPIESHSLAGLAEAGRETDPLVRSAKTVAALKQGSRSMQATCDRLRQAQQAHEHEMDGLTPELTPEAQAELEALKEHIKFRIRKRAEEEMVRCFPEQSAGKRRRPPRRRMKV